MSTINSRPNLEHTENSLEDSLKISANRWSIIFLLLVICLSNGCALTHGRLERELSEMVNDLPEPPNSILLSKVTVTTHGADRRCDGYVLSRLYGTDEPIENIVEFVEQEILTREEWSRNPGSPGNKTSIGLVRNNDGYRLAVGVVELRAELLKDPFFLHKEIQLNQPYKTIYEFNVVHIDPLQVKHCWGYESDQ